MMQKSNSDNRSGALLSCFRYVPITWSLYSKQTWVRIITYLPATLANMIGNIILLPIYGYQAAAWISVFTYFIFVGTVYRMGQKYTKIYLELRKIMAYWQ
jgi:O-antigen/teichoic acid export membrane protein